MKRKTGIALLMICCFVFLTGCACEHAWLEATCTTPAVCSLCEEAEGAPLGHSWLAATCTESKTCEVCGETDGEPLGHSWVDAACTVAKTCSDCGMTDGEALGHNWLEATTEAPKTCASCGETEGERILADPRFTTAACASLFGTWAGQITVSGSDLGILGDYAEEIPCIMYLEFGNAGDLVLYIEAADEEQMKEFLRQYTIDVTYQEMYNEGLSKEEIDEAMQEIYGMSVEEYVAAEVEKMDINALFSAMNIRYVYYVQNYVLYLGYSWDSEMVRYDHLLNGDTLYLPLEWMEMTQFTRVSDDLLSENSDRDTQSGVAVTAFLASILFDRFPLSALLDPCTLWRIAMYGVAGILCEQFAGQIGTFTAMHEALVLTADGYRTFTVERVAICGDAAHAAMAFLVFTSETVQAASGVDDLTAPGFQIGEPVRIVPILDEFRQFCAGKLFTRAAVREPICIRAFVDITFAPKDFAFLLQTAAAAKFFFELTSGAVRSAFAFDHAHGICSFVSIYWIGYSSESPS